MNKIEELLIETPHRPYELPKGNWVYYQEWNRAIFLHWEISFDILRKLVPEKLVLDSFDGKYYVSLVAFTMEKIRPRFFPSVSFISNFDEINVRTYVEYQGKKGVYFLNIEAGKLISTIIAKSLSGLPYKKSYIKREEGNYIAQDKNNSSFKINYKIQDFITNKSVLDLWLTERYCLYLQQNSTIFRYDIHHKEWELNNIEIENLKVDYTIGDLKLFGLIPNFVHYSRGVEVVSWKKEKLDI
jgi:uncharacterized protein YqjF (DUF2071 family)